MKKFNRLNAICISLFSCSLLCGLVGCGEKESGGEKEEPKTKYTVTFNTDGGTSISPIEVEEGSSINKPTNPTKGGYIFLDWYKESAFTTAVTFPLVVNSNLTLYAKYQENLEYFLEARDNTVGDESLGFEYDSNLNIEASTSAGGIALSKDGSYVGKSYYSKDSETSYYQNLVYSGVLFPDMNTYSYIQGSKQTSLVANKEDSITSIKEENVDYKYDSSSYAKSLFTYSKEDIKAINTISENKYEIISKQGFSSIAKTLLNNVNNKLVELVLGELPETNSTYHNYVTFDANNYIKSFSYEFSVSVSLVTVNFNYSLDFTKANEAPSFTIPSFEGLNIGEENFNDELTNLNSVLTSYKKKEYSDYSFVLKTGVDFDGKNEINATLQGETKRKLLNNKVYFNNKFEIDSDFKNDDLYKNVYEEIKDYSGYRAKLSGDEVFHVYDPIAGFKVYTEVKTPSVSDEYLLFLDSSSLVASNISFIQKATKDNIDTYSIGTKTNGIVSSILKMINSTNYLDREISSSVPLLGTYEENSIKEIDSSISFKIENNVLSSIEISLDGEFNTKFNNSKSYSALKSADYKVDLTISINEDGNYSAPSDKKDIASSF